MEMSTNLGCFRNGSIFPNEITLLSPGTLPIISPFLLTLPVLTFFSGIDLRYYYFYFPFFHVLSSFVIKPEKYFHPIRHNPSNLHFQPLKYYFFTISCLYLFYLYFSYVLQESRRRYILKHHSWCSWELKSIACQYTNTIENVESNLLYGIFMAFQQL